MKTSANNFISRKSSYLPTDLTNASFDGISPLKSLGQNFLVDARYRERIIGSLNLDKKTFVLELGPGRGALTHDLAQVSGKVCAVEIDKKLAESLSAAFVDTNVSIIHADAMKQDFRSLIDPFFKKSYFVANLPYYIATPLVVKAISSQSFDRIFFMIQKELADRFIASTRTKAYGAISVLLQATCSLNVLFDVPRSSFAPVPGVDSCFVELIPLKSNNFEVSAFSKFVRSCFSSRRKTIRNNLLFFNSVFITDKILSESRIDRLARPEQLSPGDYGELFKNYLIYGKN